MKRQIIVKGDVAIIPLTRGYEAIIDAVDVHLVEGRNWSSQPHRNTVYARRGKQKPDGKITGNERSRKWVGSIKICGRRRHLGYFDKAEAAHHAYAAAATELFGEFARAA